MRKLLPLFLAGLLVLGISCDNPTESKSNPYEQQPIDWPSLAESPWPMYHGSPLCNGLSLCDGPVKINTYWKLDIVQIGSGVAIDDSGNIYVTNGDGFLYKISYDGKIRWKISLINEWTDEPGTPILLRNGNIYVHLGKKGFLITKVGVIEKQYDLPGYVDMPSFQIDMEGNFYGITRQGVLFKMTQEGSISWLILPPDSLDKNFFVSTYMPVFLPDGSSLIVGSINHIYCIDLNGEILWYQQIAPYSQTLITSEGLIYIYSHRDTSLNCFTKLGDKAWRNKLTETRGLDGYARPAVTKEGDIIFPIAPSRNPDLPAGVAKFNPFGKLIWQISLPIGGNICSEIICDYSGRIYASTNLGPFYILSSKGTILAQFGDRSIVGMAPAIFNNTLIFGDQFLGGGLYAIE